MKMLDVNAAWGFWPIQHFSQQSLKELDQVYAEHEVEEVWLSAVESILYPEPDTFDLRLFEKLKEFPRFQPVKTVNPLLGNWKKSLEQARSQYAIKAIKLFPNYQAYSLEHEAVAEVCQYAVEQGLPVLVQIRVNDERNQPQCMQVNGVSIDSIVELSQRFPECRIIALNAYRGELKALAKGSTNLAIDISFLDGVGTMDDAENTMGKDRVEWGTGAPFLHVEAAVLKLRWR